MRPRCVAHETAQRRSRLTLSSHLSTSAASVRWYVSVLLPKPLLR
jgi:hypothetical protein